MRGVVPVTVTILDHSPVNGLSGVEVTTFSRILAIQWALLHGASFGSFWVVARVGNSAAELISVGEFGTIAGLFTEIGAAVEVNVSFGDVV